MVCESIFDEFDIQEVVLIYRPSNTHLSRHVVIFKILVQNKQDFPIWFMTVPNITYQTRKTYEKDI